MHLSFFDARVILLFITVLPSIILISYCLLKGRRTKLLYSYVLLQIIVAVWSTGQIFEMLARDRQGRWMALIYSYIAMCYIGFVWLLFCGLYTENQMITKKRSIFLLLIPPSLSYLLLLTNERHHLFLATLTLVSDTVGILFWFNVMITYIYVSIGIVILIRYTFKQSKDSRIQPIFLILSALIPFVVDILSELQLILKTEFLGTVIDLTPFSLSLSLVIFGVISFKYRFLNIVPVAWQKIMNHMKEAMLIIDRANAVVNYNRSFKNNFPKFIQTGTDDLGVFTQQLTNQCGGCSESNRIINAIRHGATDATSGELTLITPEWKCFSVYIQSILSQSGETQGRIVLFNDITHDKKLLQELHDQNDTMTVMNQELAFANQQLKNHARTVEELAVAHERNRIARDIHDSVGHNLTLLIALLEVSIDLYDQNSTETRAKLLEATVAAREGLQELRRSIRHQTGIQDLLESLQKLFANFEASGIQIDFSVEGIESDIHPQSSEVLYRISQEALTNAVRHGKAKQAAINLRFSPQMISLNILDNGQGCQMITKGMGLTGMEHRVQELNGTIEYGSSGEKGFCIKVQIPVS
ncbi:MAG TPA: histidine kinase N-terminal 7TM domain-containing protein [Bacillota bacterium]|nr:histidine kinase N-terminal 7TM domain-containing protein [Bacillota bacterium]